LFEAYERLKAQLTSEGVFDAERKHALPLHPQTIGIVTSTATAALRDIVSTLKRRMSSLKVIVYPTAVQGKGSEFQIAKAIHTASERNEVDTNDTNSFDFGLAGGLSYKITNGLFVSGRYVAGLTEAKKDADVKNSVIQFSVGYMF
jgi:opacity protein-like surface antigen